jgi:chemotaxis signal transduction protein
MTVDQKLIDLFRPVQEIQTDEFSHTFLIVTLNDSTYGIETHRITELISLSKVSLFLESSSIIKGVLNWHSDRIPVLDIRAWLGAPDRHYDDRNYIVVLTLDHQYIGLIVDQVGKITNLGGKQAVAQTWTTDSPQSLPMYLN